jgi:hypothetical protein
MTGVFDPLIFDGLVFDLAAQAPASLATRGYGYNGTIALVVTRGYTIGEAIVVVEPVALPQSDDGLMFPRRPKRRRKPKNNNVDFAALDNDLLFLAALELIDDT